MAWHLKPYLPNPLSFTAEAEAAGKEHTLQSEMAARAKDRNGGRVTLGAAGTLWIGLAYNMREVCCSNPCFSRPRC